MYESDNPLYPFQPPGQCTLNLDGLSGKYPPLIIQNDDFIFPTSEEADGSRLLVFGQLIWQVRHILNHETSKHQEKGTITSKRNRLKMV